MPMKVLLVDDSKSARYALRLQLQRHGVNVETAEAAEAALERIKDAPPDAIFMDHSMPGMNGFEALDIIKGNPDTAHIPVVMCTSNEELDFVAQADKKGAMAVLAKATAPDKLEKLLAQLQSGLEAQKRTGEAAEAAPDVTASTVAQPATASLTEEQIDERIRALMDPLVDQYADRIASELRAEIDEKLNAALDEEAARLRKHLLEVQADQVEANTKQRLNELLPQSVRQELEKERPSTAQMVQELVDASLGSAADSPALVSRLAEGVELRVAERATQAAKRAAAEIAESVANKRVEAVAEGLLHSSAGNKGFMYMLAGAAALVGVASAAAVFVMLA